MQVQTSTHGTGWDGGCGVDGREAGGGNEGGREGGAASFSNSKKNPVEGTELS